MKTKFFTLFFALVASIGTIFADSGTCGDNLTWNLTNGVLTISGTGEMYNYADSPWWNRSGDITSVIVCTGATSIGCNIFAGCQNCNGIDNGLFCEL